MLRVLWRVGLALVVFVAGVAACEALYHLMSRHGVAITGDEPSYIMLAQAMSHSSVHVTATILHDLSARVFGNTYPPGATVANVERAAGPTGIVSPFDPGLSVLLLPFVVVFGPVGGGTLGVIAVNVAGLVWLHRRSSYLGGLDALGQVVLAAVFALPAVGVAATQIYPDLPSGLLAGAGVVELAIVERDRRLSATSLAAMTVSVAGIAWLQPKNVIFSLLLLVGLLTVLAVRRPRTPMVGLVAFVAISVGSLVALGVYNTHYYGHLLGLPEPPFKVTRSGIQHTLGLLWDRDQGLFVQVPFCLVGLAGLVAYGWRRLTAAVAVTFVYFAAILVLNGTYPNFYGGYSLAGRFMWTLMALSLPWVGLILGIAVEVRKPLGVVLIVVLAAWVYEAEPIFAGLREYYNPLAATYHPWPTWWRGLDHLLPRFGDTTAVFGAPSGRMALEVGVDVVAVGGILWWLRKPLGRRHTAVRTLTPR